MLRCLKAWGAGVVILGLPFVFLHPGFYVGSELWKFPVSLFITLFPVLLFFEFVLLKALRFSRKRRLIALSVLFAIAEIEFSYLPESFTQVSFEGSILSRLALLAFVIPAAILVSRILKPREEIVIVQKEYEEKSTKPIKEYRDMRFPSA